MIFELPCYMQNVMELYSHPNFYDLDRTLDAEKLLKNGH